VAVDNDEEEASLLELTVVEEESDAGDAVGVGLLEVWVGSSSADVASDCCSGCCC
jgi:hypothetical protein